jgi:predicted RNase H-like HicB family nuclease
MHPPEGPAKVGQVLTSSENPTLAHYLELPYSVAVKCEHEGDDSHWSAVVEELPGCGAHGSTPDEAVERLQPAMRTWLAEALADGREIPVPAGQAARQRTPSSHSGRFLVRMPGPLHEQLATAAKRERLSLNRFVTNVLAASVSPVGSRPRTDAAGQPSEYGAEPSPQAPREPSRALRLALTTNLIVVVLAGLAAVVLFVLALQTGV